MKKYLCLLFVLSLARCDGSAELIPENIPDHQPVQPGEHPRLLFRRSDLADIRRRAQTPEGKRIVAQLKKALGGGESLPEQFHPSRMPYQDATNLPMGAYSISHAAGFGMLYQLTGDQKYADLGRRCLEIGFEGQRDRDSNARYSMTLAGEELRLGPSLAWTALGYDLLYDGLDPAFRQKVALHIQNYEMEAHDGRKLRGFEKTGKWNKLSMRDQAMRPRYGPGSNHYANITGGNAFALMAIYGDPGTDTALLDQYLERLHKNALSALGGFGKRGFFHEGQGPSLTAAYPSFLAYWAAVKHVKGLDYSGTDKLKWITLRWLGEVTQSALGSPAYAVRHESYGTAYGGSDIQSSGTLNEGKFSQGFGVLPKKYHPAALWMYQNYFENANGDEFAFDTSYYPHHAIQALVNWPIGVTPQNPEGIVPKAYVDDKFGHYVIRNGWHDDPKDDIVITVFTAKAGGTRVKPWKSLPIKVYAMGRYLEMPTGWVEKRTKEVLFETDQISTTVATSGGTFGFDFSGRSGVAGVMVSTKKLDTGYSGDILHQTVGKWTVITFHDSPEHPKAVAVDGGVQVGGLKIALQNNRFVFSEAAPNPDTVNAFEIKGVDPKLDAVTPETIQHPGAPDALLSFDYEDMVQVGDLTYFRYGEGEEDLALVYNVRPEHLQPGVFGEAFPFRPKSNAKSLLGADPLQERSRHPILSDVKGIFSRVELPAGAPWQLNGSSQTICFWLKLNEPRDGYALIVEPFGSSYHFGFHPGPSLMTAGKFGGLSVSFPNDPGVWQHVAFVRDAERGVVSMYLNGMMLGRARARGSWTESRPTYLGGRRSKGSALPGGAPVEGDMDEFAVYNRALTAGELTALSQSGSHPELALAGPRPPRRPPTAYIDTDVEIGAPPLKVSFSAARSLDPAQPLNPNLRYEWKFGDGTTATGLEVSHTYKEMGEHVATLTVTSSEGMTSKALFPIKVFNRPPSAVIVQEHLQGNRATFSAATSSDPDGGELSYLWKTPMGDKTTPTVELAHLPAGSHEIACTVTDPLGASATAYYTVSVLDAQGYRLPESPATLLPGLHVQLWEVFRDTGEVSRNPNPNFHSPDYGRFFNFQRATTLPEFSLNDVHGGRSHTGMTFAGYLRVPRDGEYTIRLHGQKRLWLEFGNQGVIRATGAVGGTRFGRLQMKSGAGTSTFALPTLKLRAGDHRIKLSQAMSRISRNTTTNIPLAALTLVHSDGTAFTASQGTLFRSPLPAEAAALGKPALRGPDLLSLGSADVETVTPVAGNRPPVVRLVTETRAHFLGTKAVQFRLEASDPDGDELTWTWQGLDGRDYSDRETVGKLFHSGVHAVSVIIRDGRGGETAAVQRIEVPEINHYGRGFGFNFTSLVKRQGEYGWADGVIAHPGETFGAVPMAHWIRASQSKGGLSFGIGQGLGHTEESPWRDGQDTVLPVQDSNSNLGGSRSYTELPRHTRADDRFMAMGALMEKEDQGLSLTGIPYRNYDVLVYLSGNPGLSSPPDRMWDVPESTGKKKKKAPRGKPMGVLQVMVNGKEIPVPAGPHKHYRWNGMYSPLNETNPAGNVLVVEGLSGEDLTVHVTGSLLAGVQVLERK